MTLIVFRESQQYRSKTWRRHHFLREAGSSTGKLAAKTAGQVAARRKIGHNA
jgi:hypothetical protein